MKIHHFDAIVIGAGQGGSLAVDLAKAGKKTALIEKGPVGGTCINIGCTPTKTLIASARIAELARRGAEYGVVVDEVGIDWEKISERRRAVVEDFRSHYARNLARVERLEIIHGTASFVDAHTMQVVMPDGENRRVQAPLIVIATGTRNTAPEMDGLDKVPFLDSTSIMEIEAIPEHLVVLGGGVIAVEFGQLFKRLGARVTIVEKNSQMLPREDSDISACMTQFFHEDGIEIILDAEALSVEHGDGIVKMRLKSRGELRIVRGSHILVATGRHPNTDALNLSVAGVETDSNGYIRVNENLQSSVKGIYALGDVAGSPQFTHMAYDDFRILRDGLLQNEWRSTSDRLAPYVVFTDPQLGRIGLTEREAKERGLKFCVAQLAMNEVARPIETGETRGMWKVLVEKGTGKILGGAFLSMEGGEINTILQMAMAGGLVYADIRDMPLSHPTLSEALNNLFIKLDKQLGEKDGE